MCGEPWTPSWPEPGQSYQKGPLLQFTTLGNGSKQGYFRAPGWPLPWVSGFSARWS